MILIDMEMPRNCVNCKLSHDYVCLVTEKYLDESWNGSYGEERPDWCPLHSDDPIVTMSREAEELIDKHYQEMRLLSEWINEIK